MTHRFYGLVEQMVIMGGFVFNPHLCGRSFQRSRFVVFAGMLTEIVALTIGTGCVHQASTGEMVFDYAFPRMIGFLFRNQILRENLFLLTIT